MKKILLLLFLLPFTSFADQNAYLTKAQADKAVSYIKTNGIKELILWCGCCKDDPMRKVKINNVYSRYTGSEEFYEVVIQGDGLDGALGVNDPVDLSYVWIPAGKMAKDFASVLGLPSEPCSAPFEFSQAINNTQPATPENTVETAQNQVYTFVNQMPEPTFDVNKYLSENLRYPLEAITNNIEGRVIVKFVVDEHGFVTEPKVMKGIGYGCDTEATRVILMMPRWKPGRQDGKPVRVYFSQPINFRLSNKK